LRRESSGLAAHDRRKKIGESNRDHDANVAPLMRAFKSKGLEVLTSRHDGVSRESSADRTGLMARYPVCGNDVVVTCQGKALKLIDKKLLKVSL
jgi:hypothetical protein